jgi:hypothetical protein
MAILLGSWLLTIKTKKPRRRICRRDERHNFGAWHQRGGKADRPFGRDVTQQGPASAGRYGTAEMPVSRAYRRKANVYALLRGEGTMFVPELAPRLASGLAPSPPDPADPPDTPQAAPQAAPPAMSEALSMGLLLSHGAGRGNTSLFGQAERGRRARAGPGDPQRRKMAQKNCGRGGGIIQTNGRPAFPGKQSLRGAPEPPP